MGLLATKKDLEKRLGISEKRTAELEAELRQIRAQAAKTKFTAPTASASAATGNAGIREQYKSLAPGPERREFRMANIEILQGGQDQ